ncbi:hypothetical protein vseg_009289 [Gypsophila vaccaria]
MTYEYDRLKDIKEFDNTKLGVKGLVDSGITQIPRLFCHPPETLFDPNDSISTDDHDIIPVVDLSRPHHEVVQKIQEASVKCGFFQVLNHNVPVTILDRLLKAVKAFHELPPHEKMRWYDREWNVNGKGVGFFTNHDIYYARAGSWRDTIHCQLGPTPINPDNIPDVCRAEIMDCKKDMKELAERLMGYLSEGLGLNTDRFQGETYVGRFSLTGNYYPHCPEPTKTVGFAAHTDPGIITILLQDLTGGLQVQYKDTWINVKPVRGALIVNIGDLFQIISNDKYKSGGHRVIANPCDEARVSIAIFFNPGNPDQLYGSLPELVSEEKPALYQEVKFSDYMASFLTNEVDGKLMINNFRL